MRFPLAHVPAESWLTPPRSFGAARDGGRWHGAIDLYCPIGTPVYAIQDGLVGPVCGYPPSTPHPYNFVRYREDFPWAQALEVTSHDGSGIWRYCELKFIPEMKVGHAVKEGDLLGHVADLGLGYQMLHLEAYSKATTGALTISGFNKYGRRADLVDPTAIVSRLAEEWAAKQEKVAS